MSLRLSASGRSLVCSIFCRPMNRWSRRCSAFSRGVGSMITKSLSRLSVLKTAPPQPASNARAIISPVLVTGDDDKKNGFRQCRPQKSISRLGRGDLGMTTALRSGKASAMAAAAFLPSLTLAATVLPAATRSPPPKIRGSDRRIVSGSARGRPLSASRPDNMAVNSAESPAPMASTTMSAGIENSLPGTSTALSGTKRPG